MAFYFILKLGSLAFESEEEGWCDFLVLLQLLNTFGRNGIASVLRIRC